MKIEFETNRNIKSIEEEEELKTIIDKFKMDLTKLGFNVLYCNYPRLREDRI